MTDDAGEGVAPSSPRHQLPSRSRLHQTREFQRVYQRGSRASGEWITVVCMRQMSPRGTRLGVSVSKDNGSAVRRNKIKRLLREAFRLERNELPQDLDIVLIPKTREDAVPLPALRLELRRLCVRALETKRPSGPRRDRRPRDQKPSPGAGAVDARKPKRDQR